jgi:hypothetical protein
MISLHQWLGGERLLPPAQSRQTEMEMLDGNLWGCARIPEETLGIVLPPARRLFSRRQDNRLR